jgi:hypothetical protein
LNDCSKDDTPRLVATRHFRQGRKVALFAESLLSSPAFTCRSQLPRGIRKPNRYRMLAPYKSVCSSLHAEAILG